MYKTVRTVTVPRLNVDSGNLRVSFDNGPVTWGKPRFTNALLSRREGEWMVPQWGTFNLENEPRGYSAQVDRSVKIEAHQETKPDCNYVELLYALADATTTSFADQMAAGRAAVAPLTAALDLVYGERILGPILTEEIGEVFDDWHWNRLVGGGTVAMEGQARLDVLNAHHVARTLSGVFDLHGARTDQDRNRMRVAALWYWRADKDADPVLKFLRYWLCIEALELGESSNIAPIKRSVAAILDVAQQRVAGGIGRVYRLRNKLAHGTSREVDVSILRDARAVSIALLEQHLLGGVSERARTDLFAASVDR